MDMPSLVWCFKSQNRYDYGYNMSFYYLPQRDDPHIQLFANTSSVLVDKYNEIADSFKKELFKELNEMKKGDTITILEIGAGSGAW